MGALPAWLFNTTIGAECQSKFLTSICDLKAQWDDDGTFADFRMNRTENSSSFCWEDLLPVIFRYPNKRIISSQDSSCHLHKNQVPMPFLRILHQSVCASYRLVQEDGDERMFWPVTIFRILSLRCPSRSVIVLRYVTPPWKEKCTIEAPTSERIGSQQQELRYV